MANPHSASMPADDGMQPGDEKRGDGASAELRSTLDPEPGEALYKLLYRADEKDRALDRELRILASKHGNRVYSELIYLLSHLRFEPQKAKDHWQSIMEHQDAMQKRLDAPVDARVALVSYFIEVSRQLENPKIIELKLFEQTQACAYKDELTGLYNYRFFGEYLAQEILRGERRGTPLSLVMVDVDNFKHYNDRNGHEAGNEILATLARLLTKSLRRIDVSTRYGGEEFALILPATLKADAQLVAERARRKIEQHKFPRERSQPGGELTVSMGIATYPADATTVDELVQRADRAMYVAKVSGKNQVRLYGRSRRSFRRVNVSLDGKYRVMGAESCPFTTLRISEGGVLFLADRDLPLGTLIDFQLKLPRPAREIAATGRVVRVEETETGKFEVAVRILDMKGSDRSFLTKYIRGMAPGEDPAD